jgi:hypothetical protein
MKRGKLLDPFKEQIMETCYNSGTVSIRTNIRTNIRFKTAIRTNIRPNYYYAIRWSLPARACACARCVTVPACACD